MVALQVAVLVLLCLIGVVLAVFARKLVAWKVRSYNRFSRNLEADRRQYIAGFLSYNTRTITFEIWLLRITGTLVALGSAVILSLLLASRIGP